jgi:hypothetical protein
MKNSEFLRKAKALIDTPEKWTQGYFATDGAGIEVDPDDPHAQCFCSLGALWKQEVVQNSAGLFSPFQSVALTYLRRAMEDSIPYFNDYHNHTEVMAAWDAAIAAAELDEAN